MTLMTLPSAATGRHVLLATSMFILGCTWLASACDPKATSQGISGVIIYPSSGTAYLRCLATDKTVECRPASCLSTETQLPAGQTFPTMKSCKAYTLFLLCYNYNSGLSDFACQPDYNGCQSPYTAVGTAWTYSTSSECLSEAATMNTIFGTAPATGPFIRCNVDGTPTCLTNCGANPQLTDTAFISWNSLSSCQQQLYWAKPCYHATSAGPYFNITYAYDTTAACTSGTEAELLSDYFPGANAYSAGYNAITAGTAYYTANRAITHYRCQVITEAVCRPTIDNGANVCAGVETEITSNDPTGGPTFVSLKNCTNYSGHYYSCYDDSSSLAYIPSVYSNANSVFSCPTDYSSCSSSLAQVPLNTYFPSTASCGTYPNQSTTKWIRCLSLVSTTTKVICRPYDYNAGSCKTGETKDSSTAAKFSSTLRCLLNNEADTAVSTSANCRCKSDTDGSLSCVQMSSTGACSCGTGKSPDTLVIGQFFQAGTNCL